MCLLHPKHVNGWGGGFSKVCLFGLNRNLDTNTLLYCKERSLSFEGIILIQKPQHT